METMTTVKNTYTGKHQFYVTVIKRTLDAMGSVILLALLSPVLLLLYLLVLLSSGFPVIFRQERVGRGCQTFEIYKFRTMVRNADQIGPISTAPNDVRITSLGRILRLSSLDELPQLVNILKGDMSFIGYRPDVPRSTQNSGDRKYQLLPGVTGYAQIHGRSSLGAKEKAAWEDRYVDDVSFLTDCRILMQTVAVVLKRSGTN